MFAVVAQDVVSILAESGAGTQNHSLALEARIRIRPDSDGPAARKFRHRNLLHRSPAGASDQTWVVDDPPITHIKAMMDVAAARRDEMRGQWRLFSLPQCPRIREPSSRKLHHGRIAVMPQYTAHIVAARREVGEIASVKAT